MKLNSRISGLQLDQAVTLRVRESRWEDADLSNELALVTDEQRAAPRLGLTLLRSGYKSGPIPVLPEELSYLREGDIVHINPNGSIWVMYRKSSPHNAMLVTERCNSRCLMCSQPPKPENDDHLIQTWLKALPLMSKETPELGITGGEPTLLFDNLLKLITATKEHLPATSLHMLSNGRTFSYLEYAKRVASIQHPDFMIGIPLYADVDHIHDFVVQAKGAFNQTVKGVLNLGRVKQKIELRFVIHQQTFRRLPDFARFVTRNLPFVDQVALMGLELMGYAKSNIEALWIDPVDYQRQMIEAVGILDAAGLRVSIYNLPLCLLPQEIWPFARKSISDWKNIYFEECTECVVKDRCAGFFASALVRRSQHIKPVLNIESDRLQTFRV